MRRRRRDRWETLEIELEEAGDCSWWKALRAPVDPASTNAFLRFVGRSWGPDGRERGLVRGETFPRFLAAEEVAPDDAYSPGWQLALQHLRAQIEADGWQPAGCGLNPWALRYVRAVDVPNRGTAA